MVLISSPLLKKEKFCIYNKMQDLSKYISGDVLFDGHYRLIKLLSAEGGTADVWLAENYESVETKISEETDDVVRVEGTGVLVAIKIYRPKNILDVDGEQSFRAEFKTIFNCHHANLLPTTDYSIFDGMPYLVMPFCENGSAESLVGKLNKEDDIWKFLSDVSAGLSYLHSISPQIIHQDIKPANILIDTNNNYCITDFGISIKSGVEDERNWDNEGSGTTIYMPPERFEEGYVPNASSDIWSLGATVYELLTGDVPFGDKGGAAQVDGTRIPTINKSIPKGITKIVYACLDPNPKKRPTAEYIAEYAHKKGKKSNLYLWISLFFIVGTLSIGLFVWYSTPKPLEPFLIYKNKGDSILTLQKQETSETEKINYKLTHQRLYDAKYNYTKVLNESFNDALLKDSVEHKILSIREIFTVLEQYKGVCDTIEISRQNEMPVQERIFSSKRDSISDIIKNKINNL